MTEEKTLHVLDAAAWRLLLEDARSFNAWTAEPVETALLERLQGLVYLGPTSFNCQPLRILFLTTPEMKERLRPALMPMNVDKTMSAPVVAILAIDQAFHVHLDNKLSHKPVAAMMQGNPAFAEETATRNANLQAGYFILTARGLGLDCGPMSGIIKAEIDRIFFAESDWGATWRTNFVVALGHGRRDALLPRLRRLEFSEACKIL
jgi:3-hydroxypropanoate dehydrogenase